MIRDAIEAVIPAFHDYNARIAEPGGFRMDTPASRREWRTENGKANFIVSHQRAVERENQPADTLILATLRSHDQYNTTIYGMNDRYRGITGRRDVVFLSAEEAMSRGLSQGDVVNVQALDDNGQPCADRIMYGLTVVIYNMAAGSIGAYLPEANVLLSLDAVDTQSLTPAYKSVPVILTQEVVPVVNFSPLSASRCVEVYDDVDLCPVSVAEQVIRAKNSRQPAQAVLF